MPDVTSRFADLEGVSLHYLMAGEGDPVVLLHGVPQSSHEWRHVIPRLAEHYRVIAPDLRGLGDSSRPPSGYDKKTIANDVWQLVNCRLGIERFFLVGHDWGGPVAFSLAAQHSDAVRRLAILDVVIPGDGADFSQGGRRWHHAFFRTLDLPEALCIGREELIIGWLFENYGYRPNCIAPEDQREYFRTYTKFGTFRAMLEYYRALPIDAEDNKAFLARSGKLKMPVLALGGDKSFGRGMECLQSLRRVAEDVRGGVIADCGHWLAEEQPEVLAERLEAFFDEDAPRTSPGDAMPVDGDAVPDGRCQMEGKFVVPSDRRARPGFAGRHGRYFTMENQANPSERPKRFIESDRVEGTAIYGTEGEHVGTIRRLIIEKVSGRVVYVTFSAHVSLEGGDEEHTIPWGKLKYDTGLGGYRTDITARELREAPAFARDDDDLEWWDRVREEELHDYYRIPPYWRAI